MYCSTSVFLWEWGVHKVVLDSSVQSSDRPLHSNRHNTTMQSLAILFIWFVPHIIMASSVCPISPASVHAKCAMTIKFDHPCDVVRSEMEGRIQSTTWVDPHNQGTYTILDSSSEGRIEVSRLTGDKRFTDKMAIEFDSTGDKGGQGRCTVRACSTSQVTSILDFSTNYCNLRNLYCNSETDGCPVFQHELTYQEKYDNCWQRTVEKCISSLPKKSDL